MTADKFQDVKSVGGFLDVIKHEKHCQLAGIELDLRYWQEVIGEDDEDSLRDKLDEERNKIIKTKEGNTYQDNRDQGEIDRLNKRIEEVSEANNKIRELEKVRRQLRTYLKKVNNLTKDECDHLHEVLQGNIDA